MDAVPDVALTEIFNSVEPDKRITVVQKEALSPGALVRYIGTREVKTQRGVRDSNTLHTFATVDAPEDRVFALWGTGQLNQQIAQVARGALMFLGYRGKLAPDDGSGVAVHSWAVNVANRPLDKIPDSYRNSLRPCAAALVGAIDVALAEEGKRFADRVAQGQKPTDDDYLNSFEHFPGTYAG